MHIQYKKRGNIKSCITSLTLNYYILLNYLKLLNLKTQYFYFLTNAPFEPKVYPSTVVLDAIEPSAFK
jgi:hypothetical protein